MRHALETSVGVVGRVPARGSALWAAAAAVLLVACGGSGGGGSPTPGTPTLKSIALTPGASVTLSTGAKQQFGVIGTYSDASTAPVTSGVTWSSSSPRVAALDATGLAIATTDSTSAGTTTITASVGPLSATASLTVTPAVLQSISISPATAAVPLPVLQSFAVIGHYSDGTTAPLIDATWSCSDSTVASLDSAGFAQGIKVGGPITITASAGGFTASATLSIIDPVLVSMKVSPEIASIPAGFGTQLTVDRQYSGSSPAPSAVSWVSADPTIATVSNSGLVHGVAVGGPVLITATDAASGTSATASITVTAAAPVTAVTPAGLPAAGGPLDASGSAFYKVGGLTAGTEYLVGLTSSDVTLPSDLFLTVDVYQDSSFATLICSTWAGGPVCRSGAPSAAGELFVLVSGVLGRTFSLDVRPLPLIHAGAGAVAGSVNGTETYLKADGLTTLTFQASLGSASGSALDPFADMFVYDGPAGPFGAGLLCSTVQATSIPKTCVGTVPPGGVVYVTVESWLTAAGTSFSVAVTNN